MRGYFQYGARAERRLAAVSAQPTANPSKAPYKFSARWRRNRPTPVRNCEFDNLPCGFCPRVCRYASKLKLLERKVHGEVPLKLRNQLFAAVRGQQLLSRRKTPLK